MASPNSSQRDPQLDDLLNRIGLGCNQSAETLYRQYSRCLYAFIRMRIPDNEAAEELVNDTFMIAFRKHQSFDGSASFKTWLFGIAKNVCGTWLRKQQSLVNRLTIPLDDDLLESTEQHLADYKGAETLLEEAELDEALALCIDKLPARQRETLHWAWHEELSVIETAHRMACSAGTVKTQLHHARNKVMNCLRAAFGLELAHA